MSLPSPFGSTRWTVSTSLGTPASRVKKMKMSSQPKEANVKSLAVSLTRTIAAEMTPNEMDMA